MVINGMTPGPIIECNVGDRVLIKVKNNLGEPTSMHWHGVCHEKKNFSSNCIVVASIGIHCIRMSILRQH